MADGDWTTEGDLPTCDYCGERSAIKTEYTAWGEDKNVCPVCVMIP